MFVQVIQGKIRDAEGLRAAVERWRDEIASGNTGWLGSTGGATADGTAIAVVRFESEEAARRNSERPEQTQWWGEVSKFFDGDVTFHDCPEVVTFLRGGSDDAGFVQIIQGESTDRDRLRQLMEQSSEPLSQYRPEVIGGLMALHGDRGFTQVVYFTSEEAARQGEQAEPPPEAKAMSDEVDSLFAGAKFFDLQRPWLHSPK